MYFESKRTRAFDGQIPALDVRSHAALDCSDWPSEGPVMKFTTPMGTYPLLI